MIEQLKNGVNAMRIPVNDLNSNWAYMVMAALAWNRMRRHDCGVAGWGQAAILEHAHSREGIGCAILQTANDKRRLSQEVVRQLSVGRLLLAQHDRLYLGKGVAYATPYGQT